MQIRSAESIYNLRGFQSIPSPLGSMALEYYSNDVELEYHLLDFMLHAGLKSVGFC